MLVSLCRFANNGFSYENCELLVAAIAASNVTRLFFDWNPIPSPKDKDKKKKPEGEDAEGEVPQPDSLFSRL